MKFTHFHVHSQYSILDGAASISGLIDKAVADGMPALSLTDHGNMFGIKLFTTPAGRRVSSRYWDARLMWRACPVSIKRSR